MKAEGVQGSGDARLKAAAFLAKAMSDENRLRIICVLANGQKSVSEIVDALHISQPLASHHLKELKRSLLVTVERSGPFVYYGLADKRLIKTLAALSDLATDLLARRTVL